LDNFRVEGTSPLVQQMQNSKVGHSPHLISRSISHDQELHHHRVRSISFGSGRSMASSVSSSERFLSSESGRSMIPNLTSDGNESLLDLKMSYLSSIKEENLCHPSPPSVLVHFFFSLFKNICVSCRALHVFANSKLVISLNDTSNIMITFCTL